jgi:RNA polymerase sigma factor (sigma-70 family)
VSASPEAVDLAALIDAGVRLAHRLAAKHELSHETDELCDVAMSGLARALAGHDPVEGPLGPYAMTWMYGEILHEILRQKARPDRLPAEGDALAHPAVRVEALGGTVAETLLAAAVWEELRVHGDEVVLKREASAVLHREIGRLPEDEQRLLELRYWDRLTWEAVGRELGVNEKTARDRDDRILAKLHAALVVWDRVRPIKAIKKKGT